MAKKIQVFSAADGKRIAATVKGYEHSLKNILPEARPPRDLRRLLHMGRINAQLNYASTGVSCSILGGTLGSETTGYGEVQVYPSLFSSSDQKIPNNSRVAIGFIAGKWQVVSPPPSLMLATLDAQLNSSSTGVNASVMFGNPNSESTGDSGSTTFGQVRAFGWLLGTSTNLVSSGSRVLLGFANNFWQTIGQVCT